MQPPPVRKGRPPKPNGYAAVLADLRAKRDALDAAIQAIEALA